MCGFWFTESYQDQRGEFTKKNRFAAGQWAAKNPAADLAILTAVTTRETLVSNLSSTQN